MQRLRARSLSRSGNAPKRSGGKIRRSRTRRAHKRLRAGPFPTLGVSFLFVELEGRYRCGTSPHSRPKSEAALCTLARTRHPRARPFWFSCRRSPPPPRPPRKKNTRTEACASRARARSWNNWFRKKPGLVLFPSPFLLRGSRGKFSFPLPFSLTLQTATRRLLTTHPYSSDFPFVFLLFVSARDHPTAGNPISAIRSKPNKKRPSGTKPEGLNKA